MPAETIVLALHIHHISDKAILVSGDGEDDTTVWLPISQLQQDELDDIVAEDDVELTVPEWIAVSKGLI